MSKGTDKAIRELDQVAKQTEDFLSRLASASEKLSKKDSSALFGTAGGLLGVLVGLAISPFIGISFLALSTPLTGLGVLGGILAHRGRRRVRLEKRIAENSLAANEILDRIKNLPRNAPEEVRADLWQTYRLLNKGYESQSAVLLAPKESASQGLLLLERSQSSTQASNT
jgi:hypothetical protein